MARITENTADYTAQELFKNKLTAVKKQRQEVSKELYEYMLSVMNPKIKDIHSDKELSNYLIKYHEKVFYIKDVCFDWYYVEGCDYLPGTGGWINTLVYNENDAKRNKGKNPLNWIFYNLDKKKLMEFHDKMKPLAKKQDSVLGDIREAKKVILELRTLTLLKKNWPEAYDILKAIDSEQNSDPCKTGNTCDRTEKLRAKLKSKK